MRRKKEFIMIATTMSVLFCGWCYGLRQGEKSEDSRSSPYISKAGEKNISKLEKSNGHKEQLLTQSQPVAQIPQLKKNLAQLNQSISDLDFLLKRDGFPESLNSDYLSTQERQEIYLKVSRLQKLKQKQTQVELQIIQLETAI